MQVNWEKVLDAFVNKFHLILASLAHGTLLAYQFKTGKDIGTGIQNAEYAFLSFLGAHAFTYQKYPDKDAGGNPQ